MEYDIRRMQGYHDGLAKYNPEQSAEIINICNDSSVYELIENIIERKIDGIVCISDFVASRLCNAALEMGYRVPEIFSVIGFGNSVIAESVFPPLTTIVQDFELMGRSTVNFIIDSIEQKNVAAECNIMQPTFIFERKSVKDIE